AANELTAGLGIAPRVAAQLEQPPALATWFITAREMESQQLREPQAMQEIATALRAMHDSGTVLATEFDSFRIVETYAAPPSEHGVDVPADYEWALAQAHDIEAALSGPEHEPVPCHNDLLPANFPRDAERRQSVDWEYAGMGDCYFDLGNFSVNNELDDEAH